VGWKVGMGDEALLIQRKSSDEVDGWRNYGVSAGLNRKGEERAPLNPIGGVPGHSLPRAH